MNLLIIKCYKEITSHSNVKKRNPLEKVFYKCNKIQQIKIRDIFLKLDFNSINKNDIFSSIFLNDIKISLKIQISYQSQDLVIIYSRHKCY